MTQSINGSSGAFKSLALDSIDIIHVLHTVYQCPLQQVTYYMLHVTCYTCKCYH